MASPELFSAYNVLVICLASAIVKLPPSLACSPFTALFFLPHHSWVSASLSFPQTTPATGSCYFLFHASSVCFKVLTILPTILMIPKYTSLFMSPLL